MMHFRVESFKKILAKAAEKMGAVCPRICESARGIRAMAKKPKPRFKKAHKAKWH